MTENRRVFLNVVATCGRSVLGAGIWYTTRQMTSQIQLILSDSALPATEPGRVALMKEVSS